MDHTIKQIARLGNCRLLELQNVVIQADKIEIVAQTPRLVRQLVQLEMVLPRPGLHEDAPIRQAIIVLNDVLQINSCFVAPIR